MGMGTCVPVLAYVVLTMVATVRLVVLGLVALLRTKPEDIRR
jgi:hypothetical protein